MLKTDKFNAIYIVYLTVSPMDMKWLDIIVASFPNDMRCAWSIGHPSSAFHQVIYTLSNLY